MTDKPKPQPVEPPAEKPELQPLKPPTKETPTRGNRNIQLYGQYRHYEPLPPGYHVNDYAVTGNLADIPNMDRLTRAERKLMDLLPGISETAMPRVLRAPLFPGTYLAGGQIPTVGAAMEAFGKSWLGKLLSFIDVPAEGLERGLGFVAQAVLALEDPKKWDDFWENTKPAWFAGSLAADVTNMPMWDHENRRWFFPGNNGDLPGADKLVEARQQIAGLIQNGMRPGDALVLVRDEYYESLGALQLRAQIHDAVLHMAADPLIIMPFLKPIEAAKVALVATAGEKIADTERLARFAAQADELTQFVRIERIVQREAEALGDTARAVQAANRAKLYEGELTQIQKLLDRADELKLGHWEERLVRTFGLDQEAGATGVARIRLNPFALTPASRASLYFNTLLDNITTRLFNRLDDAAAITRSLEGTANGLFTRELGHHILTIEGRMLRANIVPIAQQARVRLREFELLQDLETPMLLRLATEFGDDPVRLLERIKDGEDIVAAERLIRILRSSDARDPIIQAMVRNSLPLDEQGAAAVIERLKELDNFPLISVDAFKTQLAMDLADIVAKNAVLKFGMKARGALQSLADAVKAAETLAFLKMNPTYPIRNAFNNFLTSIARGVFGDLRPGYYENIFELRKLIEPARFRAGVGFAGLPDQRGVAKALAEFNRLIREAENGKPRAIDKITDWFNRKQGLYMAHAAQELESKASVRAFGTMWVGYMQKGWKPGVGYSTVEAFSPELARMLGPELSRQAEGLLRSSWSASQIDEVLLSQNANATVANILERARVQSGLGQDLENILGPGWTQQFGEQLQQAILRGPDEVQREIKRIWKFVQNHIEEQAAVANDVILQQAAARIQAEGMGGFPYVLSESVSDLWGVQQRHAVEMAKVSDWVLGLDDPIARGRFWDVLFRDNDAFYGRYWKRIESRFEGAGQGIDQAITQLQDGGRLTPALARSLSVMKRELRQVGKNWQDNWKGFYARRLELYSELKGLRGEERARKFNAINRELNDLFDKAIVREDTLMLQLDELASSGLPDAERAMFMAHRNRIAQTRTSLRQSVLNFRRRIEHMNAQERAILYRDEFWPEYQRTSALLEQQETAIRVALEGDPEAQLFMGLSLPEAQQLTDAKAALLRAEQLTDDQVELLARVRRLLPETEEQRRLRRIFGSAEEPENLQRILRLSEADTRDAIDLTELGRSAIFHPETRAVVSPEQIGRSIVGLEPLPTDVTFTPERQMRLLREHLLPDEVRKLDDFRAADEAALRQLRAEGPVAGAHPRDLAAIGENPEVQFVWSEWQQAVLRRNDLIANANVRQPDLEAQVPLLRRAAAGEVLEPGSEQAVNQFARRFATAEEARMIDDVELAQIVPGSMTARDVERTLVVDLPPQIRDDMQSAARLMERELVEGGGVTILFIPEQGISRRVSGNPPWYRELFRRQPNTNRQSVLNALRKIADGEGDTGPWVERMKAIIVGMMEEGHHGVPPNPELLRLIGAAQGDIRQAREAWAEVIPFAEVYTDISRRQHMARLSILERIESRLATEGLISPSVFPEQIEAANRAIDAADDVRKTILGEQSAVRISTISGALSQLGNPVRMAEEKANRLQGAARIWTNAAERAQFNLRESLLYWATADGAEGKALLIQRIQENPQLAKQIQDAAQWWLRENGYESVRLHGGKLSLYRETKKPLEEWTLQPYDSFTAKASTARDFAGDFDIIELEIPVENIFTHFLSDAGFREFRNEAEFIVNELGVRNATVVSINGRPPLDTELAALRVNNPDLKGPSADFPGLLDFHRQMDVPREMILGQGIDELWFTRGHQAMESIENAALQIASEPSFRLNIPEQAREMFASYIENVKTELGEQLNLATKMGEWGRDSALLNYNRRMNYNTWLGMLAPYEFWTTNSIYRWALHSIDRPQMLAAFLRTRQFLETAFRPEENLPRRLRGHIRIALPFLPDWMGGRVFIDPLRAALPIDQFGFGVEAYEQQLVADEGRAERVLEELLNDGQISEQAYAQALLERSGPAWDRAYDLARLDDSEGRNDPFDLINMLVSMHAPIQWAYNYIRGTPERIPPFLPITRSIRATTAALGLAPNTGGYNPEAMVREALGLPRFDQWDDYRADRMLANMAATGEFSVNEVLRAMIDRQGDVYLEAVRRAGLEYAGGHLVGAMGRVIGMPLRAYPPGEEHLRGLKDNYEAAWAHYEETGDLSKYFGFLEHHPEYEARLALWKTPEQRLRRFLVDEIWNMYQEMPKLHRDELRTHLGPLWENAFLSRETRNYDAVSLETLQAWMAIMGGDPPGQVQYNTDVTPLDFAPADHAYRMQVFYDVRERFFDYNRTIWPMQQRYFQLDQGDARRSYLRAHPLLEQYWNWRRDFMERNPDIVKYIEDDPERRPTYPSEAALQAAVAGQPGFTQVEWQQVLGRPSYNLVLDHLGGQELPAVTRNKLDVIAAQMGLEDWSVLVERVGATLPAISGGAAGAR